MTESRFEFEGKDRQALRETFMSPGWKLIEARVKEVRQITLERLAVEASHVIILQLQGRIQVLDRLMTLKEEMLDEARESEPIPDDVTP